MMTDFWATGKAREVCFPLFHVIGFSQKATNPMLFIMVYYVNSDIGNILDMRSYYEEDNQIKDPPAELRSIVA